MNTIEHHITWPTVFWAGMGVVVSFFSMSLIKNYQPQSRVVSALPIIEVSPTPIVVIPTITVSSELSSDGTKQLKMKTTMNKDNTNTYEFFTSDETGMGEQLIFKKQLETNKSMEIPFNTWSPDNAYFFIQEHGEVSDTVMVFNASGEAFAGGEQYLDPTALFKERAIKNSFVEATGWASPTLILINSTTSEGAKGPSYWFEVPSKAIIQLSTRF